MDNMDHIRECASDLADQVDVVNILENVGMQGTPEHAEAVKELRRLSGELKGLLALSNSGRRRR